MRPSLLLPLLASTLALADIQFVTPTASTAWTGGETVTIEWKDSGSKPPLSSLISFTLWLCWGSNADPMCLSPLGSPGSKMSPETTTAKVQIPAAAAADGKGVFFIRMESVAQAGGFTRNYSPRFSLSSMEGTFTPAALLAQKKGDTAPPKREDLTIPAAAGPAGAPAEMAKVPYTLQTGPTKYAPMQLQPGKTIDKNAVAKRQYPTSEYSVFKRKLAPTPDASTTITLEWDYEVTSVENRASPAPMPLGGHQKLFKRWRD